MYEKYHVKSNDEIRQAKKKPGKREINKALSDLEKKDTLCRRIVSKKFGWKQSSFINWKVEGGYYFYLEHLNCYSEATLYVKPLYIDDLWWDVFEMSSNKKAPMSLRGNGTFSLDGVKILKTPDLFDIRTNERGAEYELEKIQKYSNEDIEKIWDNVFRQFDDEVKRFLKENPDPDSYFPEEEKCHEYYMLITYLHAGDRQKVLDKIAEFRAIPNRIKTRLGASYDGKTRDGLDFIEAWCLRELAEQGDVMAQYKLGTAYEEGSCVHIDNEKAVFWYRKAAEQGNSSAQYSLGRMFDYGCGVPEDKQEAAIWYRKAAEQGDGNAQNDLGVMYLTGEGVPEDKSEAIFWLQKAAEQGVALAQNNLGIRYLNGDGIPEDKAQAAFWFRKAAEQGLAAAQFNLGVRCFKGDGVPEDKSEAVSWFQKAAEQGLEEAQINLDLILQDKQETLA
ncbi:tetratricopeptide repeat protein [Fibrobacter sp.]|uniref:tetratricopeptide repeat protein n=1 Tax=Fibrobacter sp. TaxID=35828 RepID=UPI0025BAE840|nr:tetratricopeptide repeat protein [Fibrobacter sp.]MBR3072932.1 sel1 repeat family protein [Fibrobacter sp.]